MISLLKKRKSNALTGTICLIAACCFLPDAGAQTAGDAVIYPDQYIGKKIEYFLYDLKGWPNRVKNASVADDFFITDDMNGVRISIYGDQSHPAHPAAGQVDESQYTQTLNSLNRARTARGNKDFYVFASKKLDGQNSFPEWTKNANGVIVTEYVKLLTDYFLFMKSKGVTIDYLGIQNEEQYNEGNITAQKHKAIIDSLRIISVREGFKMPLIVGYEGYGPNKENWMKNMSNNGWMDRMDIYGTHYYPHLRPIANLKADLLYAGEMPFWSTEPHWDSKDDVDDWKEAEEAICAFWDQIEVGMSGFMWWNYQRDGDIRGYLMKHVSVPLKDARMIDMDDIDGRSTTTAGKLQTRAFRKGNILTIYAVNNNASRSYNNYGFRIDKGTIDGNVSYIQWLKNGSVTGSAGTATVENDETFRHTIPGESISIFTVQLKDDTSIPSLQSGKQGKLQVRFTNSGQLQVVGLAGGDCFYISDPSGRKILEGRNGTANISLLPKGVYMVHTDGAAGKFVK